MMVTVNPNPASFSGFEIDAIFVRMFAFLLHQQCCVIFHF